MKKKKLLDIDFIDLNDLADNLLANAEDDMKTFEDYLNLAMAANREVYLGELTDGVGCSIEGCIRFWNRWDEKHNIPVEQRKPIKIFIDSIGGNLTDTFTIVDAIHMSKTPVWTVVTGCAYSGGCFVAMSGHRRFGYAHSSYLFHEGSTQTGGTSSQFENYSKFYKTQLGLLKELTLSKTKLGEDWYKEHNKEDMWFTADEALEAGIIDEIATDLF